MTLPAAKLLSRCRIVTLILFAVVIQSHDWVREFASCADEDAARRVFRAAALEAHPDRCGDAPECAADFIALRAAYAARVAELDGSGDGAAAGGRAAAAEERWLSSFLSRCRGSRWREARAGGAGSWLSWRVSASGAVPLAAPPGASARVELSPREAMAAAAAPLNVSAVRRCAACGGRGLVVSPAPACGACGGAGWLAGAAALGGGGGGGGARARGAGEAAAVHTCAACCGSGGAATACPVCAGAGVESRALRGALRVRGVRAGTELRVSDAWAPAAGGGEAPPGGGGGAGAHAPPPPPPPWLAEPGAGWEPSPASVRVDFSWLRAGGAGAPRAACGGGAYCGGAPFFARVALAHPDVVVDARVGVLAWCRARGVVLPLLGGGAARVPLPAAPRALPADGVWAATLRGRGFPAAPAPAPDARVAALPDAAPLAGDVRVALRLHFPARLGAADVAALAACLAPGDAAAAESTDPLGAVREASALVAALAAVAGSTPDEDTPLHAACDAADALKSTLYPRPSAAWASK
jgi:hypothetical protein